MLANPPSIDHICPVTRAACSDNNQAIKCATSGALPMPAIGYWRAAMSRVKSLLSKFAAAGVSIKPGATALTRMPPLA